MLKQFPIILKITSKLIYRDTICWFYWHLLQNKNVLLCEIDQFLKLLFPKACSTNTLAKVAKLADRQQTVNIYSYISTFVPFEK